MINVVIGMDGNKWGLIRTCWGYLISPSPTIISFPHWKPPQPLLFSYFLLSFWLTANLPLSAPLQPPPCSLYLRKLRPGFMVPAAEPVPFADLWGTYHFPCIPFPTLFPFPPPPGNPHTSYALFQSHSLLSHSLTYKTFHLQLYLVCISFVYSSPFFTVRAKAPYIILLN